MRNIERILYLENQSSKTEYTIYRVNICGNDIDTHYNIDLTNIFHLYSLFKVLADKKAIA